MFVENEFELNVGQLATRKPSKARMSSHFPIGCCEEKGYFDVTASCTVCQTVARCGNDTAAGVGQTSIELRLGPFGTGMVQ